MSDKFVSFYGENVSFLGILQSKVWAFCAVNILMSCTWWNYLLEFCDPWLEGRDSFRIQCHNLKTLPKPFIPKSKQIRNTNAFWFNITNSTVLHQLMINFSVFKNSANQKRDRKFLFSDWLIRKLNSWKMEPFSKMIEI